LLFVDVIVAPFFGIVKRFFEKLADIFNAQCVVVVSAVWTNQNCRGEFRSPDKSMVYSHYERAHTVRPYNLPLYVNDFVGDGVLDVPKFFRQIGGPPEAAPAFTLMEAVSAYASRSLGVERRGRRSLQSLPSSDLKPIALQEVRLFRADS